MKRGWIAVIVLLAFLCLGGAALARAWTHRTSSGRIPAEARAPVGQRVRVQVLNATTTRGLARRATRLLRDGGFDVVEVGTLPQTRDSTLVLDLSGHPDWAKRVAALFGGARVEPRADSARYLDITVLVGASWRPPAEPFYP